MVGIAAKVPLPFQSNDDAADPLPILDEFEVSDLSAVLSGIAKGTYPRMDAIPQALNAYNYRKIVQGERKVWAYFHTVTEVSDNMSRQPPDIILDDKILNDIDMEYIPLWPFSRDAARIAAEANPVPTASYRLICFIHKHRINIKNSTQKTVFTISIWDREMKEMTWHDTYPYGRANRRKAIKHFWHTVNMPASTKTFSLSREEFVTKIRYRTIYHTCENIEAALRVVVAPRNTLWGVMGIAIHHMNHMATKKYACLVPDHIELFGGQGYEFLPQLFVHLLYLCLRSPWQRRQGKVFQGPVQIRAPDHNEKRMFVERCRIIDRLPWMKTRVLRQLVERMGENSRDVRWLSPLLRITASAGAARGA
ncbi:hypothetical protein F5Y18DRAFT_438254 [Xylariaceae sp. FL1019]|nr:hypothetical protein F5Y18DRAFT_438254 [Xylariaceae sp. FL1019]